ncbi:MAG: DUF3090 domain-containing protein [Candidatus Promineifilaceae bacterium]|jgi:uncharacterized repeat protein (TIGR03847 family)
MPHQIELNPVSHLTIGTVGPPGKRTFYLQGGRGSQTISLTIEKEQASMLANSLEAFLEELEQKHPPTMRGTDETILQDMRLREPIEGLFRVGNMGMGFNDTANQIVLVAYELVDEDDDPDVVSFWGSRRQMEALVTRAREVVAAGRPICGNCGRPIDASGHFCPNRNGHRH